MLKEIDIAGALKRIDEGSDQVCMLVPMSKETILSVEELIQVKGFAVITRQADKPETKEDPKPKAKAKAQKPTVDVGKIMALYNAGWNVSTICAEVGVSYPTVKKYIDQETGNAGSVQADS